MFNPRVAYVGFVAEKVALAQAFLRLLQFYPHHCNSISGSFSRLSSGTTEIGPLLA
jgi:hypothetical protein